MSPLTSQYHSFHPASRREIFKTSLEPCVCICTTRSLLGLIITFFSYGQSMSAEQSLVFIFASLTELGSPDTRWRSECPRHVAFRDAGLLALDANIECGWYKASR